MFEALKDKYQVGEEMGRGRFGTITRVFCPETERSFACKSVDKRLLADATDRECLENEPKLMTFLSPHPHILQVHDMLENDDFLHLVLDLCRPDTLYDHILRHAPMTEAEAAGYVKQLMLALAHCHRFRVLHRDVKPENVLFDERGRLKLADFGSAALAGEAAGVVGTPYYVAPEVLMGREYDEKVDVWSAGVVLYVMLAGVPPFYGENAAEIFEAVVRGNLRFPSKIFRTISAEAKDLLRKMICRDASKRFSAEQVLRHPWILNGGEIIPED